MTWNQKKKHPPLKHVESHEKCTQPYFNNHLDPRSLQITADMLSELKKAREHVLNTKMWTIIATKCMYYYYWVYYLV